MLFYWVWTQGDCRQDIWWDLKSSSNSKNKQWSTAKYMWVFYVFFQEVCLSSACFAKVCNRTTCICYVQFFRSFSNVFIKHQAYSHLYFEKEHLPARFVVHAFVLTSYGGCRKWLVTNCFFVQSKSLRKGKKSINHYQHIVPLDVHRWIV